MRPEVLACFLSVLRVVLPRQLLSFLTTVLHPREQMSA